MKKLILLFALSFFALNAQQDFTYILEDMQKGWSIGNGCGQFEHVGYREVETNNLEVNDEILELMWVELTVYNPITKNGVQTDVLELLSSGQIILKCEISESYENESTIIVIDRSLSLPDKEINNLKVYPNPASQFVNITGRSIKEVICYDTNSRKLFQITKPSEINKVYLFNFSDGLYHLVIKDLLGGMHNRKLIVKR